MSETMEPLLSVRDLSVGFGQKKAFKVLENVSFDLAGGEVLGVVGESGSGKSVTALSILKLISAPGRFFGGSIRFQGEDLIPKTPEEMRRIRGKDISMIFQEPMSSLNPVFTVGQQIGEVLRIHEGMDRAAARKRTLEMLDFVSIPSAARRIDQYPHEMSGGMRQRVMIALALSCNPRLLLADEPTTALDVTVQAQIMDLLRDLQQKTRAGVMIISHDLGVIAEIADRVIVMYSGQVIEDAPAARIFSSPAHPYTEGLLKSRPSISEVHHRLPVIPGAVPRPGDWPTGCRFAPRCPYAKPACSKAVPDLIPLGGGQSAACIRHVDYQLEAV